MIGGTIVAVITFLFTIQYVKELWFYFFRYDDYDRVVDPKMRYGEIGGEELSPGARLIFGFPLFILVGGVTSFFTLWEAFNNG